MARINGVLITGASVLYPVLVFLGLIVFDVSPRILSLLVVFMLALNLLSSNRFGEQGEDRRSGAMLKKILMTSVVGMLFLAIVITNSAYFLKMYPIIINLFLLTAFCVTLFRPPSMILRVAILRDPHLMERENFSGIETYCRKVTIVWCVFFVFNVSMATYSTFFSSDLFWTIYNGGIAYVLMGLLFFGEIIFRRFVQAS